MRRIYIPLFLLLTVISLVATECPSDEIYFCQCGCEGNGSNDEIPADEDLS